MIADIIENRKTIVLAAGIFFVLMANLTVLIIMARGCSEQGNRLGDPVVDVIDELLEAIAKKAIARNTDAKEHNDNPAENWQVERGIKAAKRFWAM